MHRFNLIPDMKKASQIMQEKVFLVVMTSSMTSQGDLKVAPLYSLINEKQDCFLQKVARVCASNAFVIEDSKFKWCFFVVEDEQVTEEADMLI